MPLWVSVCLLVISGIASVGLTMSPDEYRFVLEELHWPGVHVAESVGYHRSLSWQWATGRVAVPDHVAAGLRQLLAAHRRFWPPTRETPCSD